jgi:hypothetical protein
MAEAVYILCALTSLACAVMLLRGYWRGRARFLLWSSLCFVGLAINNAILFADKVLFPNTDLMSASARSLPALAALLCLLYGLIWDTE